MTSQSSFLVHQDTLTFLASHWRRSQPSRPISFSASEVELSVVNSVLYVSDLWSALNWAEQTQAQTAENIFLIDSCSLAVQSSLRVAGDFHANLPRPLKSVTWQEISNFQVWISVSETKLRLS